jgi:hypothetical protein
LYTHPTIVVPVEVALGTGYPLWPRKLLREYEPKSKPDLEAEGRRSVMVSEVR